MSSGAGRKSLANCRLRIADCGLEDLCRLDFPPRAPRDAYGRLARIDPTFGPPSRDLQPTHRPPPRRRLDCPVTWRPELDGRSRAEFPAEARSDARPRPR